MMKRLIIITLFLLTFSCTAQNKREIKWIDFKELNEDWQKQPKKILLFFHEEGCVYCRKMEIKAFKDYEVVTKLNEEFYAISMDAHTTDTIYLDHHRFINPEAGKSRFPIHELAAVFITREGRPISFPVTVLLDESFQVIDRSFNYLSPKEMRQFIDI